MTKILTKQERIMWFKKIREETIDPLKKVFPPKDY